MIKGAGAVESMTVSGTGTVSFPITAAARWFPQEESIKTDNNTVFLKTDKNPMD
jgi:hypothetical protein